VCEYLNLKGDISALEEEDDAIVTKVQQDDRGAVTGCWMSTAVTMDAGIGQEESGVVEGEDGWGTVTAKSNARGQKKDKCKERIG
jgi:hypothetical protein